MSEAGDETFIIAAIMAMRHPRLTVLTGALGALVAMTVGAGNGTEVGGTLTGTGRKIQESAGSWRGIVGTGQAPAHPSLRV